MSSSLLSLEQMIAKPSMWDVFPYRWRRLRLLGYASTRAKVESLWAFIDAHEKVVKESPGLD